MAQAPHYGIGIKISEPRPRPRPWKKSIIPCSLEQNHSVAFGLAFLPSKPALTSQTSFALLPFDVKIDCV
jgi:hypothetical protein